MPGNQNWIYQGRQYHGWFGHGTAPHDDTVPGDDTAVLPALEDRIHNVGLTLVAGLPPSLRYHAVARLRGDDLDRLNRVLEGVVRAWPLGPLAIPARVLGRDADAPGMEAFVAAGGLLRHATRRAELRAATDLVARSAQEMGLDRFTGFLREADAHLTASGPIDEPPGRSIKGVNSVPTIQVNTPTSAAVPSSAVSEESTGSPATTRAETPSAPTTRLYAQRGGKDRCLERCSDLALPTRDDGNAFQRCVATCRGQTIHPEWERFFPQ